MKKIHLFVFFILLAILPLTSAVQINMNSNFSQGETLTAQVFGSFMNPIQTQNILLYQGHIRVSFIPEVTSNDGIYYIYGQLSGKSPGNYSLVLSGITYQESGRIHTEDVSKNFTISNKTADYSISPGFINSQSGKSFYITAKNLGGSLITLSSSISSNTSGNILPGTEGSTQILPGASKEIYFPLPTTNKTIMYASLSDSNTSYTVPIFISPSSGTQPSLPNSRSAFEVEPSSLNISLPTSSSTTRYIYVNNTANTTEDVSVNISESLKPYVFIINNSLSISPNSSEKFVMNIVSKDNSSLTTGYLKLYSGNFTRDVSLLLNFSESYASGTNGTSGSPSLFQTCSQLGGIVCNGTSTCTGKTESAQDGSCCLGACQAAIPTSNTGKIIGWSLIGVIVILLTLFFIRRYSKAKHSPLKLPGFLKKK